MRKIKKVLAFLIILSMILSLFPPGTFVTKTYADPAASVVFQRLQDASGRETVQYVISYSGALNKPEILIKNGLNGSDGMYLIDTTRYPVQSLVQGSQIVIEKSIIDTQYKLPNGDNNYLSIFSEGLKEITITNKKADNTTESVELSIKLTPPPSIDSTTISNKLLYVGGSLTIFGSYFADIEAIYVDGGFYQASVADITDGKKITLAVTKPGTGTGAIMLYRDTEDSKGNNLSNAIQTIYQNSVKVVNKMEDVTIANVQPNTGSVNGGTYVKIQNEQGKSGLNDKVKVYFPRIVGGVMEPLSDANLATGNGFDPITNTLTVRTKASTQGAGPARIVITNAGGTSRYDDSAAPLNFTFVQAGNTLSLSGISPSNAKASSKDKVVIVGKNIGTLNIEGLKYADEKDFAFHVDKVVNQKDGETNTIVVTLKGLTYLGEDVDVVKRINVLIGKSAEAVLTTDKKFASGSTFSTAQDQLYVTLPEVSLDNKEFILVDTVVTTETFVYEKDTADTTKIMVIPSRMEEASLKNSFTYNSDFVIPTITSITPNYGPKDKTISVTIKGNNFYVMQQSDSRLYPKVSIGLDPNDIDTLKILQNIRVYNSSTGKEVDGSPGNYKGDIIKGDIPGKDSYPGTPDGNPNQSANVYLNNPETNSERKTLVGAFKFMNPDLLQYPHIINVTPNLVSTKGGEDVVITGSNFKANSELYIDGNKVASIIINGTGEQITFKTPAGRPGAVRLQVFNPDSGAMASATFEYTDVYTSPKITGIAPNKGGSKTLVTITGSNFMAADVTAKPNELYKIIGSRILFNNRDLNVYNLDSTGAIILKDYNYKKFMYKPIIVGSATVSPYLDDLYKDTVLVDAVNNGIFTIQTEAGYVYLKDANGNRYKAYYNTIDSGIELVDQNGISSGIITYDCDGDAVLMSFTINSKTYNLEVKTPYQTKTDTSGTIITGRWVRVINDNTIELVIPPLVPTQGLNDVTVLNPDTAKFTLKDGFFYFSSQGSAPTITSLYPKEGSVAGGTIIKITGTDLRTGIEVYFGSQKAAKVITSADEKTLYAELPAYPKALPKGITSVDVPVVLVNPTDGGTCVWNERFIYRVPTSYPTITGISPSKYNSAGGIDVIITGTNFMQGEPYTDLDGNNAYTPGEPYVTLYNDPADPNRIAPILTCNYMSNGALAVRQELAPRVYFGGELATVKDYKSNRLIVTLPKYNGYGTVDVVVVNPDTGTIAKKGGFTYEISTPKITAVVPAVGPKSGGTQVTVLGNNFIKINPDETTGLIQAFVGDSNDKAEEIISGGSLVKRIVMGNMTVDYNNGTADVTVTYKVKNTAGIIKDISVTKSISMPLEKTDYTFKQTDVYPTATAAEQPFSPADFIAKGADSAELAKIAVGKENVKLRIENGILKVVRRLGIIDVLNSNSQIIIFETPPSTTIGIKDLVILNNDGGTASSKFEYGNPLSRPIITSITPNRQVTYTQGAQDYTKNLVEVGYKGGDQIRIAGQDFRTGVKVFIGEQEATVLNMTDLNNNKFELLVKLPVPKTGNIEKELRVTVVNEDTASAMSANSSTPDVAPQYWVVYKQETTSPEVKTVVPNKGPKLGGTIIKITGKNFAPGARVFIGGLECTVTGIDARGEWIQARTAPMAAPILEVGTYAIQVKNYESGVLNGTGILDNAFTYISNPIITSINEIAGIDAVGNYTIGGPASSIKITGNETLMLSVADLLDGPTIVIGGKIEAITDYSKIPTGIRGINGAGRDVVVTGGSQATLVKIQNKIYAIIKTPVGKVDTANTVIIINKDGGISDPFGAPYIKPIPGVPSRPLVQAVDGDTIKIEWTKMEDVLYYELYISEGGSSTTTSFKYLGSIQPFQYDDNNLRYYVNGLKVATWYKLKIKAVNLFGVSQFSSESDSVKTKDTTTVTYYKPAEPTVVSGLVQTDKVETSGTTLNYTVGEKSIGNYATGCSISFDQSQYNLINLKKIDIGMLLLKKYPQNSIEISDKDIKINITANTLLVKESKNLTQDKLEDTKITLSLNKALGALGDNIRISAPVGYKVIIAPFAVDVDMQVKKDVTRIVDLNGNFILTTQYDKTKAAQYKGGVYLAYYNENEAKVQVITSTTAANGTAKAEVSKAGSYLVLGKLVP